MTQERLSALVCVSIEKGDPHEPTVRVNPHGLMN